MTKLRLSYAGYANHCAGQLGEPTLARPVPLMDGVLGWFERGGSRLTGFHMSHFQAFNSWDSLQELLGEEVTGKIHELYQEVGPQKPPRLSGLSEDELRAVMQQSMVVREFEVGWTNDSELANRLQEMVRRWDTGE